MSYVEHVLQPGENIQHVSRLHWIVYLPGLFWVIIGVAGLIVLASNQTNPIPPGLFVTVIAVGVILIFHAWFRRWTTEIAVTNRRVVYKRGFIRRHTIEMNMDKVESVDVDQSILGRLFDYGTITVHGTGAGIEPLHNIGSPLEFRNFVMAY